ncbi:transcriptional regulator, LysR family [Noviherbaspirillum humi]|uniref:Transcriptional regulator, LysR family n=1 Tax=Noviherbaspirillum humi TaxID=1688639 RepID=A0A239KBN5_9BURK|nr:LysR family transcriptional regulator [Noviherbaspirillum humi]SNT15817.1 transcriptional regulator, LysR family [Noviherbaspirillum humi]
MQRLNYRHLYYFWSVAREGNLTRVAEQLHVSQSALSAQIRQFEEQLGYDLFLREGRSLKITEAGRMVLGYADGIFALGGELMAVVGSGHGGRLQRLRVGAVATLSRNFQENFLRPVMGMEEVQLVLESGGLEELLARLSVHKLDLVLSNRPVTPEAEQPWRCRRIARQPVCLVGPPRGGAAPFRFPQDLHGVKLLLPGHTSDIRTQFDLLCEDLKVEAKIFAEVDDMAMLRLLTRDSGGVSLVPAVVVQDELRSGVLEQYCVVPKVHENFYAITTERQFQPAALEQLLAQS